MFFLLGAKIFIGVYDFMVQSSHQQFEHAFISSFCNKNVLLLLREWELNIFFSDVS